MFDGLSLLVGTLCPDDLFGLVTGDGKVVHYPLPRRKLDYQQDVAVIREGNGRCPAWMDWLVMGIKVLRSTTKRRSDIGLLSQHVVVIEGEASGDGELSWDGLREKGKAYLADNPNAVTERVDNTKSDDLATLIYTSGTTGKPKGVELTHSNWTYEGAAMSALGIMRPDDVQFLWLPLAHVFGKVFQNVPRCAFAIDCGAGIRFWNM